MRIPPERIQGALTFSLIRPPHRSYTFEADVLEASERLLILAQTIQPSRPLVINGETVLDTDYFAIWFLFQGQPYDVARMYRPNGAWTGYYADVLEPVHWSISANRDVRLDPLVDLFLDLWIEPSGAHHILDEDELRAAVESGAVSSTAADSAGAVLTELVGQIRAGTFPEPVVTTFSL